MPCPYALHRRKNHLLPCFTLSFTAQFWMWQALSQCSNLDLLDMLENSRVELCDRVSNNCEVAGQRYVLVVMPHVLCRLVTPTQDRRA